MKTPYKNIYKVLKLNRFIVLAVVLCSLLSSIFSFWMVFNTNQKALNSAFAINTDGSIIPLKLVTKKRISGSKLWHIWNCSTLISITSMPVIMNGTWKRRFGWAIVLWTIYTVRKKLMVSITDYYSIHWCRKY